MSKSIENAMYYSWMSQASYLGLTNIGEQNSEGKILTLTDLLTENNYAEEKEFAAEQAETFVNHYDFVHQQPNTNWGMSATVFEDKSNKGNYTIAVRGTEPLSAGDKD